MNQRRREPCRPATIDPHTWTVAQRVCTRNELIALELNGRGLTQAELAVMLGISRWAVRDRIRNAARKIAYAKETAA